METIEQPSNKVTFTNQPKLSGLEADKNFDERRLALIPYIETYLSAKFKDQNVKVTFAHKGISSLIGIIETSSEKLVLKIPLSTNHSEGEPLFLKAWEKVGVKVPHVFEEGVLDGHSFALMEYIDAPILGDAYTQEELIEKGIYREMGETLRLMHMPETEGYGRVVDGKAEFTYFKEWLYGSDIEERIKYVKEYKLLDEECGSMEKAFEMLEKHVEGYTKSSYCHDDFGGSNIFATHPITVFDPNPRFNNGYIDLSRSVLNHIAQGIYPKELIEGYFKGEPYDEKVLHAGIYLNALMKMPYKHKTKGLDIIENMQKYLSTNKHLLE